jgi:leader peptidase (prepilin peptidase)/N-methyltransferase
VENYPFFILVFVAGLAVGSFLNVVIYRLPRGKSIIRPGSSCPGCDAKIRFYDNIPVLSYIMLRGRCRACGVRIPVRYPVIELLAGVLPLFAVYYFGFTVMGFEAAFLSLIFIPIFYIDLDYTIIPDLFTLPGILLGVAVSLVPGSFVVWQESLIGLIVGGGSFFLVAMIGQFVFKKEALGLGDVKFAAMIGAFLGWKSLLLVMILASFFGSVVGIALILFAGKGRKAYIPFGPFLVMAAWITLYFGPVIINAYLDFVGLGRP